MPLVLIFIGAILMVSAFRNTQGSLASALMQDVPAYLTWAAAIVAVGAIGFIPKLQPVSRALLALVLTVIVLRNYQAAIAGFQAVAQGAQPSTPPPTPAAQVVQAAAASGVNWTGSGASTVGGGLGSLGSGLGASTGGFGGGGGTSGFGGIGIG